MDDLRGGPRDGARNNSMDEIEIEPAEPPFIRSRPRGVSESQNLLSSPGSPDRLGSAQLENQTLLPNTPRNIFHYTTTTELKGFSPPPQSQARNISPLDGIPQILVRTQREKYADLVVDVFAIATALPFYALAGALIWANGNEVENHENHVLTQLTLVAGTLFPICFSIVVGRTMVKLTSWKLEQGASLGSLERLMGSRTVGSTLITQFKMGSITLVALGLILLWILSPIGGQAVLRLLSSTNEGADSINATAVYFNSRQASYAGSSIFQTWFSGFAVQFSASLLAPEPVKNSTVDLWGNVKIPHFSSLRNVSPDANGFRKIPNSGNDFIPTYSSLFGIPISDVPIGNTVLNIETSYMDLNCANITTNIARQDSVFIDPGLIGTNGPFRSAQNLTSSTPYAIGYLGTDVSTLLPNISTQSLDTLLANNTNSTFLPGILLYQDFTGRHNVTSIYCVPSQTYVESTVSCTKTSTESIPSCNVTAQRLSLQPHMSTALTDLSMAETLIGLTSLLPASASQMNNIDILQNYIFNPQSDSFIQSATWPKFDTNLSSNQESRFLGLPLSDFGDRLSQVINTFLQGSTLNSTSYLTNFNPSFTASQTTTSNLSLTSQLQSPLSTLSASAIVNPTSTRRWTLSLPWLALYMIATTTMLLSAIASAYLTRHTISRDYLPYISNFLRDSEHVTFPNGGVRLDGFERSRIMQRLRVKLGDVGQVEGGWEVGTGVRVRVGRVGIGLEGETVGLRDEKWQRGDGGLGGGRLYL